MEPDGISELDPHFDIVTWVDSPEPGISNETLAAWFDDELENAILNPFLQIRY